MVTTAEVFVFHTFWLNSALPADSLILPVTMSQGPTWTPQVGFRDFQCALGKMNNSLPSLQQSWIKFYNVMRQWCHKINGRCCKAIFSFFELSVNTTLTRYYKADEVKVSQNKNKAMSSHIYYIHTPLISCYNSLLHSNGAVQLKHGLSIKLAYLYLLLLKE